MEENGSAAMPGFMEKFLTTMSDMQQRMVDMAQGQNEKYNELLEKITGNGGGERLSMSETQVVTKPSGPTIDAIEARIVDFEYDEEECTFENWYERYRDVFEHDMASLDECMKVRVLLRHLSVKCNTQYRDHKAPDDVMQVTFTETVKALKCLFGKKESDFELRLRFLNQKMSTMGSTDVMRFASEVNRLYQKGNLKQITEDQMKITIFLAGLDLPNQKTMRTHLFNAVSQKPAITFKELLEKYSSLRALERDVAVVQKGATMMVQSYGKDVKANKHFKKKNPEGSKTSVTCRFCDKKGHYESECWTKHPEKRPKRSTRRNYSVRIADCNHIEGNRVYVNVMVEGKEVEFQLDTGSDLTLISESDWKEMGSPSLDSSPSCVVTCANGQGMKILGRFRSHVEYCGKESDEWVHVTPRPIRLVGNDWLFKLDLKRAFYECENEETVVAHIKSIPDDYTTWVREKYPEVCETGLGKYNKSAARLYVKPGSKPVFRNKRPVPYASQQVCEDEIDRLCEMGVISKVEHSDWAAPFLLVEKKNGSKRLCADFKTGLNDCLEDSSHPLKLPEDIFASLNGGRFFSTIDFSDAYLQVEVDEEAQKLLVINTHRGLYKYHRLPFGVKPAPGIFQSIMDQMLTGMDRTVAYLDDVIVNGRTKEEHDENLRRVLDKIRDSGFRIRPEKCAFGQNEVHFLGFVVNESGRHPDPKKVRALKEMPAPKDVKENRSFLGGANYYGTFVQNMSDMRAPLDQLLKKGAKWEWNEQCQKAFLKLRDAISAETVLAHYDPREEIVVAADASQYGIGAVISHRYKDGTERPVMYASKRLGDAEMKYAQIEKEALALTFALKKFHKFVYGRKFLLQTDHRPLLAVFGGKNGIPVHSANRLQRWALFMLNYNFDIEYVNTNSFGKADMLSRLIKEYAREEEDVVIAHISHEEDIEEILYKGVRAMPVTVHDIRESTVKDGILQQIIKYLSEGWPTKPPKDKSVLPYFQKRESISLVSGCLMMADRVIVPARLREAVLKELHRGHPGMVRMKSLARSYVYWPGLDQCVEGIVRCCEGCGGAAKNPSRVDPVPWPVTEKPMERIHMDFAGPMNGRHYLIIVDVHSRWPEVTTMERITADATVRAVRDFVSRYGSPVTIVSDNGTQFKSEKMRAFCAEYGINQMFSPPYHPQSNGQAERFVDTFKRSLLKMRGEGPEDENVQKFLMMCRCTPNNQLKSRTPAEVFLGRKMRIRLTLMSPREGEERRRTDDVVTREFAKDDSVFYRDRDGPNHEKWTEATVLRKMGKVLYEIERLNGTTVVAHANQLKRRCVRRDEDPLSVPIESFDLSRDNFVETRAPSPPPVSPIRESRLNDPRSPTVPRSVPTKDVENDKKNDPSSDATNNGRPKRERKPLNTQHKELRKVNIDGDNYIIVKCDGNVLTVQDLGVCPCLPHENNHCSYRDCDVCPYRYYCPCLIGRRSGVACSHLHFLEKFKRIRASKNISSDEEDSSYEDDTPAAPPMSPIPSSPTPSVIDLDDFPTESRPVTPPTASRNEDPATQMDWNEFNQAVENLNNGQHEKRRGRDHNNCALLIPLRATGTLSLRTLEDMCFKEYSRARNFREQR